MIVRSFLRLATLAGLVAGALLLAAEPAGAAFDDRLFTAGHGDIGVGYENGQLFLHYHFGTGAVINGTPLAAGAEIDPGDATTVVPETWSSGSLNSPIPRPSGSEWDFLGTAAGQPVWYLPQSNVSGVPFLGIATGELDRANWSGPITWSVTGFSYTGPGNGQFSLWQQGFGAPVVFAATSNGLTAADSWTQGAGLHDHYNYGFTALGLYDVQFTVSGTHVTDGLKTDTATFRFQVGPNPVPEPTSLALLGLGLAALGAVGARSRRTASA